MVVASRVFRGSALPAAPVYVPGGRRGSCG
jgi:hypothetical protein